MNLNGDSKAVDADTQGVPRGPAQPLPSEVAAIRAAIEASLQEAAVHRQAAVSSAPPPAAPGPPLPPTGPLPTLRDVHPADLGDVDRLLALWAQAQARGWVSSSEADRLHVVAAAVHARRIGQAPCRLFVALLRDRRWEVITQEDEDTAQRWLREQAYGPRRPARPASAAPAPAVPLSDDAHFAHLAQQVLRHDGWWDDPFLLVHRQYPAWTLARWERAQAELTQWRLLQAQANARSQRASLGALLAGEEPWADAADAD